MKELKKDKEGTKKTIAHEEISTNTTKLKWLVMKEEHSNLKYKRKQISHFRPIQWCGITSHRSVFQSIS